MLIEVLGPACYRCVQTVQVLQRALKEDDIRVLALRHVLTPAASIDGRIVSQDRIPTIDEATGWFQEARS